jgi:hypothetical protein
MASDKDTKTTTDTTTDTTNSPTISGGKDPDVPVTPTLM